VKPDNEPENVRIAQEISVLFVAAMSDLASLIE
jgi:hypothetical protein